MRARRRRLQAHRHDARRRRDREVGEEACFYGEYVIGSRVFAGTFKEFWAWPERRNFGTRLKFLYPIVHELFEPTLASLPFWGLSPRYA